MSEGYIERLRNQKLFGKQPEPKKVYQIPKQSEKKKKEIAEGKDEDKQMDKFFESARRKMSGSCGCGCGEKSCKNDDMYYRYSIAHIFGKSVFKSIATHPMNWVERNFWKGCHTNMDQKGVDKWPMFEDWDDIKEKFFILSPLLTDEERGAKFYQKLEKLVYEKK